MGKIKGARERSWISDIIFTIGAEVADVINAALQFKGEASGEQGVDLAERVGVLAYLSDNADGSTLIAAAHSAGVAIGTNGLLIETITDKAFWLVPNATGDLDIDLTHVGAKTAYLVVVMPNGQLKISAAITHA